MILTSALPAVPRSIYAAQSHREDLTGVILPRRFLRLVSHEPFSHRFTYGSLRMSARAHSTGGSVEQTQEQDQAGPTR